MAEESACCSAGIIRFFFIVFCPIAGLQLSLEKLKIIGAASFLTSSCRSLQEGPNKTPYHNMLFKAVFSNMLCTITQILQGQKAIFSFVISYFLVLGPGVTSEC